MESAVPTAQIIDRLIEVTLDLQHGRGDRDALLREHQGLLQLARELRLIPAREERRAAA